MAKYGDKHVRGTGEPFCPSGDLGPFDGGMPGKAEDDRGMVAFEGSDDANRALAEFGGVSRAHKSSTDLSHGPVTIPSSGGPSSRD